MIKIFTDYDYGTRVAIDASSILAYKEWKHGTIIYLCNTTVLVKEMFDEVNKWYESYLDGMKF